MSPDSTWFKEQIQKSDHPSMRQTAAAMTEILGRTIDSAALSRMINGKREMQLRDAWALAKLLKVPLAEISQRMGLKDMGRLDCLIEINPGGASITVKVTEPSGVRVRVKTVGKGEISFE